jgi:hypothetical protein
MEFDIDLIRESIAEKLKSTSGIKLCREYNAIIGHNALTSSNLSTLLHGHSPSARLLPHLAAIAGYSLQLSKID